MKREEIEKELQEAFDSLEQWDEKYEYLIQLGQDLPALDAGNKVPENLIKGCQSQVWFVAHCREGRLFFDGDSDSIIVRGLVAILHQLLNGQELEQASQEDGRVFESLGLMQGLSTSRSNGLSAMLSYLRKVAQDCLASLH